MRTPDGADLRFLQGITRHDIDVGSLSNDTIVRMRHAENLSLCVGQRCVRSPAIALRRQTFACVG
jgi:hypothetical protein